MDRFVGKRLDGRYEIQEIIGVGGMAVVYKARDNVEDRIVAVKILKEEFTSNEEFVRRFKNESKAIAMLSHPNIVKVYDVSFGDLIQYIVMEYIDGITLKEFIEREGSLRWKDAVHFTLQILKGLQHAHDKGIVHRDVKPQNIMVLSDGTIKVTDFGIARFARSEQRTITDKAIGSVHYISPEQARGERTDEKADIYSVGVMMYEMLTGQLPFQAESAVSVAIMQLQRDPQLPTELNPSIPQGLEQITMHAMQKTPERRYQTASEMLCDLDAFRKEPSKTFEYGYFVDNAPTRFVSDENVRSATPAASVILPDEDDEDETKEKNNIIPILVGIAATLIVVIGILCAIFIPKFLSGTGSEIPCPQFIGMTLDELKENTEYNEQFDFEEKWEYADGANYGVIFDQSQPKGKKLKKGAKIVLSVSMGQSTVQVPDVTEKTESYAKSLLESQGFKVKIAEIGSEDVEKGLVVKTEPIRTTTVAKGSEITVYISSGKEIKYVQVPNVIGLKSSQAKSDIEKAKLVAQIEEVDLSSGDNYYGKGYVFKQSPDSGSSKVTEGTTVKVYVSTGVVNYNFNVRLNAGDLPTDFANGYGTVSLWVDGKMFSAESEKLALKDAPSYTFKGLKTSTTKKSPDKIKAILKISNGSDYYDYMDIVIDPEDGSWHSDYIYSGYPTASGTDDSSSLSEE